jgi:hypothetical protein
MRSSLLLSAIAALALTSPLAHAGHLTCNNSGTLPNSDLIGYDFTITVPVSNVGSGGGAGKVSTALTVTLPVNSSIVALGQFVESGRHSASCTLSEPGSGLELVMQDVVFSKLELLNGPNAANKTTTVAALTLVYAKETLVAVP